VNVPEPPKVVRVAQELLQASCIKCPSPEYPPLAKISRVTDTVVLSARINKQGKIEDLTVVRGHTLLRDAAVNAIRGWVYRPTMMNGEPVEVQTTISISFVFRQ
jgi:protein TonB